MLRFLRITGIVVFAMLVGIAANNLWEMHETGNLTERYNSARKANITMMVFSIIAVGTLGVFELIRIRRFSSLRGYGGGHYAEDDDKVPVEGLDSTNIYAAPPTVDDWKGRRTRSSTSRHKKQMEMANLWMGLLRICCIIMPLIYGGLLVRNLLASTESTEVAWLLPSAFAAMIVFSIITSIGLMTKRAWGISLGYLLAIFNLMIFPLGTALGLFFIMGLVGSSSEFAVPERERRRQARRKAARKARVMV